MPVVIFTSSQWEEDRARAKLLGANEFVLKPNSANGFREVAQMLNERLLGGATSVAGSGYQR